MYIMTGDGVLSCNTEVLSRKLEALYRGCMRHYTFHLFKFVLKKNIHPANNVASNWMTPTKEYISIRFC